MADVRLVDLAVIKRYSLAIRQESAPADEVLRVLDASRKAVLEIIESEEKASKPAAASRKSAGRAQGGRR